MICTLMCPSVLQIKSAFYFPSATGFEGTLSPNYPWNTPTCLIACKDDNMISQEADNTNAALI